MYFQKENKPNYCYKHYIYPSKNPKKLFVSHISGKYCRTHQNDCVGRSCAGLVQ